MIKFHKVRGRNSKLILKNFDRRLDPTIQEVTKKPGKASQNIWFNQKCLRKEIIPNYVNLEGILMTIVATALNLPQRLQLKYIIYFPFHKSLRKP